MAGTGDGSVTSAGVGLQTVTWRTLMSSGRAVTVTSVGQPLGWPASTTSSSREAPLTLGVSAADDADTQSSCAILAGRPNVTAPEKSARSSALKDPLATSLPVTELL